MGHFTQEQLTERYTMTGRLTQIALGLVGVGLVLLIAGIFLESGKKKDTPADASHEGHSQRTEQLVIQPVSNPQDAHQDGTHQEGTHQEGTHEEGSHEAPHTETPADAHSGEAAHDDTHQEGAVHPDAAHADGDHAAAGHGEHHDTGVMGRILANLLLCSVYFFCIAMGSMFFLTIHRVGNAGWHTAIMRVPEAITQWLPVGVVGFVALFFFMDQLYEWLIVPENADPLIDAKRAYLNKGFFIARSVVFFGVWIAAALYLRKLSHDQDREGGLFHFKRSEVISALFIIFFAISYCLYAIDWIKSLEPHWFSTIFGVYIFGGSMVIANATIYLITAYLKTQGYMKWVNDAHFHDLGKYTFGFSIFWAYIWLAQYLLIWYANIPEEGIYYVKRYRVEDHQYLGYSFFFYSNIIINFVLPFFMLMTRNAKRKFLTYVPVAVIVLYGRWHDLFLMIMPGAVGQNPGIGLIEIGMFMAFAGLFVYVVFRALTSSNLVPLKHPYLEESLHHTTGAV
ncbi:MAG: quinol:cytochrome C oxidoreductase [Bacteroidia bacterium]|nr:quinol:cytochrome C oxidoreductase [Bacteroidia bacterium]